MHACLPLPCCTLFVRLCHLLQPPRGLVSCEGLRCERLGMGRRRLKAGQSLPSLIPSSFTLLPTHSIHLHSLAHHEALDLCPPLARPPLCSRPPCTQVRRSGCSRRRRLQRYRLRGQVGPQVRIPLILSLSSLSPCKISADSLLLFELQEGRSQVRSFRPPFQSPPASADYPLSSRREPKKDKGKEIKKPVKCVPPFPFLVRAHLTLASLLLTQGEV